MSNSLQTLVPVLDGSNYRRWAELMKAYLQSMGSWIIIERPTGIEPPTPATDGSNRVDVIEWSQQEAKAQGSIRLRLNVEISRSVKNKTSAKDLWEALQSTYGGSSAMGAFSFFKAAINIRIPANEHPAAAISKISGNLDELAGVGVTLPMHFRALVVLGAAPPRYDATIQMVLNANELKDLKVSHVQTALVASWEQSRNKGQASAQKISAIKQKKGNLSFSQQQRPSGSSSAGQKDGDAKGKAKEGGFTPRGKRGGKFRGKAHKKHCHDKVAEMHITDMASIPAPTTATVTEIGLRALRLGRLQRRPLTRARSAPTVIATGSVAPASSQRTWMCPPQRSACAHLARSSKTWPISKKSSRTPNCALLSAARWTWPINMIGS